MKSFLSISFVFLFGFMSLNLLGQTESRLIQSPIQFQLDTVLSKTYPLLSTTTAADKLTLQLQKMKDKNLQSQTNTTLLNQNNYTITSTGLEDNFGTKYHIRIKVPDLSTIEKMPIKIVK